MKPLLLAPLLATLLAAPLMAAEQTARIHVSGLYCATCSYTVAAAMKRQPTVAILEFDESADGSEGVYTVRFDDAATTPEQIIGAVVANGYKAEVVAQDGS